MIVVGVGCQKTGTTSIARFLESQGLVLANRKELHAFSNPLSPFVSRRRYLSMLHYKNDGRVYGEFTPNYLLHPSALWNLSQVVPEARLIISLRNPIDRAFSAYRHGVGSGRLGKNDTFEQLIFASIHGTSKWWVDSLVREGLYGPGVRRAYDLFPRESILILNHDQWKKSENHAFTQEQLMKHVGLESSRAQYFPLVNDAGYWQTKVEPRTSSVSQEIRQLLQEYFDSSKIEAEALTQSNFGWW